MQTILILGSSSIAGEALSKIFSYGNHIILSGRNENRLNQVAHSCLISGALSTTIIACDLSKSIQPILEANLINQINTIVDAASTTSKYKDSKITEVMMEDIINADLISHLVLFKELQKQNSIHPNIIFISSVLAEIKTSDREMYSMLKRFIELYLLKAIKSNPSRKILIFRLAKTISTTNLDLEIDKMALQVKKEYALGSGIKSYGMSGKLLVHLNVIHPILMRVLIAIRRKIKPQ